MTSPLWMPWWPLHALGDAVVHAAMAVVWIAAAAGLLALSIELCIHLIGPTRQTALRGWITWRWYRRTARRFAHAVTTGHHEAAETHARQLLTAPHGRATPRLPTTGWDEQARRQILASTTSEAAQDTWANAWLPFLPPSGSPGRTVSLGRLRPIAITVIRRDSGTHGREDVLLLTRTGALLGEIRMRTVPSHGCSQTQTVELWIQLRSLTSNPSPGDVRKLRRATRRALRRWATHNHPKPYAVRLANTDDPFGPPRAGPSTKGLIELPRTPGSPTNSTVQNGPHP